MTKPIAPIIINVLLSTSVWGVLIYGDAPWWMVGITAACTYFAAFFTALTFVKDSEDR